MMTEAFRSGNTRIWCRVVETWGWIRGRTQAWHWGLHGYKWPLTSGFPHLNNLSTEAQYVISLQIHGFVSYLLTNWRIRDVLLLFCPCVKKPQNQPVSFASSKSQASAGEFIGSISNISHLTHIHSYVLPVSSHILSYFFHLPQIWSDEKWK